ncbi:hypothetical protein [Kitasatospora brasiliensis]|uniref:hypothetical protein n=1 Tax=Kitasatospora brasiliensis TaxID=3058040 RepID=UPI00292DDAF1|nr:hypothetical protein [Kitasatospora sp. K002]
MKTTKTVRQLAIAIAATTLALTGTVATAGTAQAAIDNESGLPIVSMGEPGILYQGQYIETGYTRLILQTDGNLVIYRTAEGGPSYAKWAAPGTWGCGVKAIMQGDGNFVVYGTNNRFCWASSTFKSSPSKTATLEVYGRGGLGVAMQDSASKSFSVIASSDPY